MITLKRFRRIEAVMRAAGYGHIIEWSEAIPKPADANAFAEQAVYVICNSGMMNRVAEPIFIRQLDSLFTRLGIADCHICKRHEPVSLSGDSSLSDTPTPGGIELASSGYPPIIPPPAGD